jgi:2-iminobutanoate/2-iminopropanoate deaminase
MSREIIKTAKAPGAIGPYSQAVRVGNAIYCSGQIPLHPETGDLIAGDVAGQTERVMENLKAVLEAAGAEMRDVVSCTVYLSDMNHFGLMNGVYGRYFQENPPSRATVAVAGLPRGVDVEISCIAVTEA